MQWASRRDKGFTIVELLVVVVVIGILAAITIVSFAGVTNQAKEVATKSSLNQAVNKILLYSIDHADALPATLADAGISNSSSATFEYSVNNSVQPATYCVTATANSTSFYQNNTNHVTPTAGGCPGHGQGASPAVTNLVRNPSAQTDLANFNTYAGGGAAANFTRETTGGYSGNAFARQTWTQAQTAVSAFGPHQSVVDVIPGQPYTGSMWVRSSKAQRINLSFEWYTAADGFNGLEYGTPVSLAANTWTRISITNKIAPANTYRVALFPRNDNNGNGANGSLWTNTNTFDVDAVMLTQGTALHGFADGSTANWVWNGTANSSSSTGPAQ